MACGHKLMDDYPIVVTVLNGRIEIEEVRSNCEVVDNYLTERELSKVYWILDAATIDFSREAAIYMAEITQKALPGSGGDPRVVPLVIMPVEHYAHVEDELKNRHFTMRYPLFHTMYEALEFAFCLSDSDKAR